MNIIDTMNTNTSTIEIYESSDGQAEIQVHLENESVWLNRQQLSSLFDRDIKTLGKHINNVFKERELDKEAVVAKFATTAADGKTYQVEHYNLDVIISVGYRVKSQRGTQFRIWATQRLREYLVQGYTLNQQRLDKNSIELQQALRLIEKTAKSPDLNTDEGRGLIEIISRYTRHFYGYNAMMKGCSMIQQGRMAGYCLVPMTLWQI
ncbi:RhuM family protein [Psychrobacter sp. P2G3]|uniref:virulence RhuM family protein n=1 Tax=Psychrobacter sp. P2G3 TaxID=1699622 RepID=UPI000AC385EA|nr:RhuM family protein [Psychrobacter sp. P2G3]